jgi:hypothetical protein
MGGEQGKIELLDPNQVKNAVLNLALNARDAMPEGGKFETANTHLDEAYAEHNVGVSAGQYLSSLLAILASA